MNRMIVVGALCHFCAYIYIRGVPGPGEPSENGSGKITFHAVTVFEILALAHCGRTLPLSVTEAPHVHAHIVVLFIVFR